MITKSCICSRRFFIWVFLPLLNFTFWFHTGKNDVSLMLAKTQPATQSIIDGSPTHTFNASSPIRKCPKISVRIPVFFFCMRILVQTDTVPLPTSTLSSVDSIGRAEGVRATVSPQPPGEETGATASTTASSAKFNRAILRLFAKRSSQY
jgi:hypothetical protein